jgi:hypothetical protein
MNTRAAEGAPEPDLDRGLRWWTRAPGGLRLVGRAPRAAPRKGCDVAKYEAYCVKCRAKREFDGEKVTMKNGRDAAKGTCPVCGTTVMRMLGKS